MYRKTFVVLSAVIMIVLLAACAKPSTTLAPSGAQGSGALEIMSTNAFTDQYGSYHVVGEISNKGTQFLASIELAIEIKNAAGESLLEDDDGNPVPSATFNPHLNTIGPGESSSFSYDFDTTSGTPASYNVTVIGFQVGEVNRADLAVENAKLIDDGSGTLYLAGALVNKGSQWAHINALAGAALDSNGKVISADITAIYAAELAPTGDQNKRDRTPFMVQFQNPGIVVNEWKPYIDAEIIQTPIDYLITTNVTNHYIDQDNSFHLIGTLTNNASVPLYTQVVAGLYAADGTVLDASRQVIPIVVDLGATVPFDFSPFSIVTYDSGNTSQLDSDVKVDLWNTYTPSWSYVALESVSDQMTQSGSMLTVKGSVINTSDRNLNGETIIVKILDTQDNIVATNYTYIFPVGEIIMPGETNNYEISVYVDPNADTTVYTFKTIVQGDVNE